MPYCAAFPGRVPAEIYFGGFDHRDAFPGDRGVRFLLRPGGEAALERYEARTGEAGE